MNAQKILSHFELLKKMFRFRVKKTNLSFKINVCVKYIIFESKFPFNVKLLFSSRNLLLMPNFYFRFEMRFECKDLIEFIFLSCFF